MGPQSIQAQRANYRKDRFERNPAVLPAEPNRNRQDERMGAEIRIQKARERGPGQEQQEGSKSQIPKMDKRAQEVVGAEFLSALEQSHQA